MPIFTYEARGVTGVSEKGRLVAHDSTTVAQMLQDRGLTPLEIQPYRQGVSFRELATFEITPTKLKSGDLSLMCRQLYTMLKAGVPILIALTRLAETARHRSLKNILTDVISEVSAGHSLTVALQQYPKYFKPIMISIVDAGEQGGQLEEAFLQLSGYFELEDKTGKRIKAATRYPIIVLVAIMAGMGVINFLVVPAFSKIFSSFHTQLPLPTRIILAVSNFMIHHWFALLLGLLGMVALFMIYVRLEEGRFVWDRLRLKFPVFGKVLERVVLARFSRVFVMLLRSGVPLVRSVDLLSRSVGNAYVERVLLSMKANIEKGEAFSKAAERTGIFPKMVLQMMIIGEEAGALDDLMSEVADFYEREVEYDLSRLADLIQPFLILIIGAMVLVLALGVFLPMWNMVNFLHQ